MTITHLPFALHYNVPLTRPFQRFGADKNAFSWGNILTAVIIKCRRYIHSIKRTFSLLLIYPHPVTLAQILCDRAQLAYR